MLFKYEDNNIFDINPIENFEEISFDSINETQFDQDFPNIPFNLNIFSDQNKYEISKGVIPFQKKFNIEEKEKKTYKILFINNSKIKNLKGRKRKIEKEQFNYQKRYIHDKYGNDNILRKIQVHFLSFIVHYANTVLIKFDFDEFFVKIDYKLKKAVNKVYISYLKGLTIGDILCWDISPKFKIKEKEYNRNLYYKAIKNQIIKNIFSEKYLSLFRDIYFENKRIINLTKYGLNDTIKLSEKKVQMYKELLEKNEENEDENKRNKYINKLKNCINKIFLPL